MDEIKHKFRDFLDKHQVNRVFNIEYIDNLETKIVLLICQTESKHENSIDGFHRLSHKEKIVINNASWIS